MIAPQELRKTARERRLALDLVEKDYILGWLLFGIASSSSSKRLAFKGGTALSKIYFPGQWRLSEDLDFTLLGENDFGSLADGLSVEVPDVVRKASDISVAMKKAPFRNPNYLQNRFQYTGPVSKNTVKIEVSKEGFIGEFVQTRVPKAFDYPSFSIRVYTLENILAEKMRTLLQRGKVKDYYDVWKLLAVEKFDNRKVRELFLGKCQSKNVAFKGIKQFFPPDLAVNLRPHMKLGLTRLSSESLPPLEELLDELKKSLAGVLD